MRIAPQGIIIVGAFVISGPTWGDIPSLYKPIPVEAPFSFSERQFDLTVAVEKAKAEKRPLFIYLGARDCPPCHEYERFLEKNHPALEDLFAKVVMVDIRTWLRGPKLIFQIGDQTHTFEQFKERVGDTNNALTYPYFWLLSPELKQIKQLPRGSRHFLNLDNHRRLLSLDRE